MPIFSPDMTNAASAGFQGQDLATQLLLKQQQAQRQKAQMQDEDTQRKAKALIGQKLTEIMQAGGQTPPAGAPAPGAIPGGAGGGSPMSGGQQMPQGQPGSAMGAPGAQFSWNGVLDSLRHMTGADHSVIADAVMDIMPEIDKESSRKASAEQAQANRDQKNYALLQTLQWRYQNSQDQTERTQIKADMQRIVAGMNGETARDVDAGKTARQDTAIAARQDAKVLEAAEKEKLLTLQTINKQAAQQVAELQKQRAAQDALAKSIGTGLTGSANDPRLPGIKKNIDGLTAQISKLLNPPKASGGPVPVNDGSGASIDTPDEVKGEPDDTVFKMGGKTYTKKGAKSVAGG